MMDKSSRDSEIPPTGKLNDSEKSVDVKSESW